jgi:hypothetical protein
MYEPVLNHVLVEIDDREAAWGGDQSADGPMGKSYNKGKLISVGDIFAFGDTARLDTDMLIEVMGALQTFVGRPIMWHKGHEGESIFEHEGKQYAFIFWWDIVGVKPQTIKEVSDRVTAKSQLAADARSHAADIQSGTEMGQVRDQYGGTTGQPPENDDVKATRKTLKKHGVPAPQDVEIIGGGPENGNFTAIR